MKSESIFISTSISVESHLLHYSRKIINLRALFLSAHDSITNSQAVNDEDFEAERVLGDGDEEDYDGRTDGEDYL